MPGVAAACATAVWFASLNFAAAKQSGKTFPDAEAPLAAVEPRWGVHVFAGASAGETDLKDLLLTPWRADSADNYLIAGAVSRRLGRPRPHWIVEAEIGAGYRFKEVNSPEAWSALYLRYDGFPWSHLVYTTVAVSTGVSYIAKVPKVERDSSGNKGARLLHYFSPELTFAAPENRNTEFVLRYHHRSGVFGHFNSSRGGSNVMTGGVRQRF